jgi:hypothetical protein
LVAGRDLALESTMRLLGLVAVIVTIPGAARAETVSPPWFPPGFFLRIEPGVAVATIRQKTTTSSPLGFVGRDQVSGDGVGGQAELAIGRVVTPWLQLGGFFRAGRIQMDLVDPSRLTQMMYDSAVTYMHVGPQVSLAPTKHLYARVDVGLGRLGREDEIPTRFFHVLAIGTEAGYATYLGGTPFKLGIAVDAAWATTGEDGDTGLRYESKTRLVSVALVGSFVFGAH